jgi:hypothetical protein
MTGASPLGRALMAVCAAPLVVRGCGDTAATGVTAPAGREEAPRVLTSGAGIDVVAVNGNLYEITPSAGGDATVAVAKLRPMFGDSAVPGEADAAAAVSHAFAQRGCRSGVRAPLSHEVRRDSNEQRWTFAGYCA